MEGGPLSIAALGVVTGVAAMQFFRTRGSRSPTAGMTCPANDIDKQNQFGIDTHEALGVGQRAEPSARLVAGACANTQDDVPTLHAPKSSANILADESEMLATPLMAAEAAVFPKHKLLEAGTLVYFLSMNGELVTVTQAGSVWTLQTMSLPPSESGYGCRPTFIPPSSIFMVLRKRHKIGFRSLGAEGRNLQAVNGPTEPPRVANYNFGPWESWVLKGDRLVNCKWADKVLPLTVHELRVLSVEDVWREELIKQQRHRHLLVQIEDLERVQEQMDKKVHKLGLANAELQQQQHETERKLRELTKERDRLQRDRDALLHERDAALRASQASAAAVEKLEGKLRQLEHDRKAIAERCEQDRRSMLAHQQTLQETHQNHLAVLTAEMERLQQEGLVHSTQSADAETRVQRVEQDLQRTIKQLAESQQEVERLRCQYDEVVLKYDEASKVIKAISSSLTAVDEPPPAQHAGNGHMAAAHAMAALRSAQGNREGQVPLAARPAAPRAVAVEHKPMDPPQNTSSPRSRAGVPSTPDLQQSLNPIMRSFFMSTEGSVNGSSLLGGGTPNTQALLDFLYPEGPHEDDGLATPRIVDHEEFARLSSAANSIRDDAASTANGSVLNSEDINMLLGRGDGSARGARPRGVPAWANNQRGGPQAPRGVPSAAPRPERPLPGPTLVSQAISRLQGIAGQTGSASERAAVLPEEAGPSFTDGRTQRWVAEDDQQSVQTTAIESVDLDGSMADDRPLWPRTRSSFLDRQLPNMDSIIG